MDTKPSRAEQMARALKERADELIEMGVLPASALQSDLTPDETSRPESQDQLKKRQVALKKLRTFLD